MQTRSIETAAVRPWYGQVTRTQWNVLFAAQLGWMLDAMDVMLYAFALTTIQKEFELSSAAAGVLASATLITSSFGGILFGILADRIGRTKSLIISILAYSVFTAGTATAQNISQLLLWRSLVGIGLGGEWSAGSVLVSETWSSEHRGKAMGLMQSGWALGYIAAAIVSALILPRFGWRALFMIGIVPALITFWIRRNVPEPTVWKERSKKIQKEIGSTLLEIFKPALLRNTIAVSAVTVSVLFAYWGLFTWLPGFLSTPVEKGGAGMSIVKTSAWIIPMQIGAFLGYVSFGFIADRIGRRPAFISFLVLATLLVPIYGQMGRHEVSLMLLGPFIGFFGHGYFSLFGAMLAELFPTHVRATGQGFTYNIGRAFSAFAPFTIGKLADRYGLGSALMLTSVFFLLGGLLILLLPETRGKELE